MRKYLLLCIICLQGIAAFCQPKKLPGIENLKQELQRLKGIKYVDKTNEISSTYGIMGQPKFLLRADSILKYATLAFNEAVKIGYKKGTAEAYINKAASAKIKSTGLRISNQDETPAMEEMVDYLIPALKLGKELKNDEIIADALWQLEAATWKNYNLRNKNLVEQAKRDYTIAPSVLYHNIGNEKKESEAYTYMVEGNLFEGYYEKAFDYSQQAISLNQKVLPLSKTKEEQQYRIWLCQQSLADMATLYKEAGDYQSSLDYLNRSVEFGNKYQTGWFLEGEKAEIFRLLEQYDSAFAYIKKIRKAPSDNAWNNLIIGQTFLATNNMDSALYFLIKTYKSFRDINQMAVFTIPVSIDIAKAYAAKNDFNTAKKYVSDAMALAANSKSRPAQVKGYEVLSRIHYGLGNSDSAYLYLLKHNALKDSIQNRQFLFRINTAKKEAQIGLLNKDNKIKEQQLKQQAQLKKFILLAVLALLLIGFFFTRNLLLKKKNEKFRIQKNFELHQLENEKKLTELEMQALRAQMNPHFIFNCLSSINKFILKNEPDTASDYLTRFSRLIRMVLINSKKPLITLEDELDMLTIYLDMERLRFKNTFDYQIAFTNRVDAGALYIPSLLLQPFCENAIWHGLRHLADPQSGRQELGRLDIVLSMNNKVLNCSITDNGIGRQKAAEIKSKSAEDKKSLGLKITTERLALLNKENDFNTFYKIKDVLNDNNEVAGTRVELKISYKESVEELV